MRRVQGLWKVQRKEGREGEEGLRKAFVTLLGFGRCQVGRNEIGERANEVLERLGKESGLIRVIWSLPNCLEGAGFTSLRSGIH